MELDKKQALKEQKAIEKLKAQDEKLIREALNREEMLKKKKARDEQRAIKKELKDQRALEKQKAREEKNARKALIKEKALEEKKTRDEQLAIERANVQEEKQVLKEQKALENQKALEEKQARKAQAAIEKAKTLEERRALKALDKGDTKKKQIICILGGALMIFSSIANILLLFTTIYGNITITSGAESADTFFIFLYVNGYICLVGGVLVILGTVEIQKPLIIFGIVIDLIGAVMFLLVGFWAASLCGDFMIVIIGFACIFFGINMLGVLLSFYSQKNLEVSKGDLLKTKISMNVYDEYNT